MVAAGGDGGMPRGEQGGIETLWTHWSSRIGSGSGKGGGGGRGAARRAWKSGIIQRDAVET